MIGVAANGFKPGRPEPAIRSVRLLIRNVSDNNRAHGLRPETRGRNLVGRNFWGRPIFYPLYIFEAMRVFSERYGALRNDGERPARVGPTMLTNLMRYVLHVVLHVPAFAFISLSSPSDMWRVCR